MSKRSKDAVIQAEKQQKKALRRAKTLEKKQKKAEAKAQKNAILSVHKRPIVCPPDKAGRHILFRVLGYLCRTLVVWLAAAGFVTYLNAAFKINVPVGTIFTCTLVVVALVAIALYDRWGIIVSSVGAVGSAVVLIVTRPSIFTDLLYGILSVYNAALQRLVDIKYDTYEKYQVAFSTSTSEEELLSVGIGVLCVIVGAVFAFSLVRRVRIIPPAILATTFLVVTLTFNVYSNLRDHDGSVGAVFASNLGIVLVIVSFATVLVMAAYDRLYRVKDDKRYDTGMNLFNDERPAYPPEYVEAEAKKSAEKAARKAANKSARKAARFVAEKTVDEELTDYFGGGKKKSAPKKASTPLSPAEKKQKKAEERAIRKQVNAVKRYDRITEQSRAAMGGFASAAALVLAFLIILLPAMTVTGRFEPIEAIDEKMSYARDYVTALLRGNDAKLDELEYEQNGNNFRPRSTDLEQLEFTGKQIFYLESRYNTNYYLRGWIGTDYKDGAWQAVSDDTLNIYRDMFDTTRSPGEEFRYQFFHYMKPSLVDNPDYNNYYLSKYQSNLPYGFVNALVSLRRVNSPSSHAYFPTTFKSVEGMFEYGSTVLSETSYVNYFDGIYTGRAFEENDASQATVTYAQVMTSEYWAKNQADLIAAFNLQREVLLAKERITVKDDGTVSSSLLLYTEEQQDGTTLFSYQCKSGRNTLVWRTYHDTDDVTIDGSVVTVATPNGTIQLTRSGNRVQSAEVLDGGAMPLEETLVYRYANNMTTEERQALMAYLHEYDAYANFVYGVENPANSADYKAGEASNYSTYTGKSDSLIIKDLAAAIVAQAHTEVQEETLIEEPDDPATEEDESFSYVQRTWVDVPADVSLAAVKNAGSAQVYVQRDLLVRNVIDYIIYDLGCEYSITPDLSNVDESMDGVENFLVNTKEGYCVQFASSAALILRELGIPVRYAEGYIASGLENNGDGTDMTYGGYVRDYEAHAWIEVYFDGIGWIQYETTPQYYGGMYGVKSGDTIVPSEPVIPPELETSAPDVDEPDPDEDESETDDETGTGDELPDDYDEIVMIGTFITLGIILGIAVIAGIIYSVVSSARNAENQRQSVVSQVLERSYGTNVSEGDRREMAFSMVDSVNTLLKIYDLAPHAGEFREEYADRLTAALTRTDEKSQRKPRENEIALPDLRRVMEAMSAEEFGHGMSVEEMKLMAAFYLYLRRELKARLPMGTRFYLRYIKRLI